MMKTFLATVVSLVLATSVSAAAKDDSAAQPQQVMEKGANVKLPSGAEVSKLEVIGVMTVMRGMASRNPMGFASLVKKAYEPKTELDPNFMKRLTRIGIMNEDGSFATNVEDIIKAFWSVDQEGHITFVAPEREHGMQGDHDEDSPQHQQQQQDQ